MQAPFDNIVQHLFHQPSLHSVTVDELEHLARQHPYFAAAHFLLLKKMQDTQHPDFTAQLHKTTLYFNNPLWLQFLLQPETVTNFTVSEKSPFITDEPATQVQQVETPHEHTGIKNENAPVHDAEKEIVPEETPAATIIANQTGDNNIETAMAEDSTQTTAEITAGESHTSEPANEMPVQKDDQNIIAETVTGETNKDEPALIKTFIETPAAKNDLLFEPYHTVDYFASQGIKLSKMEAEGKDRLGRQLKSFTEWLKTMKKLPQVSIDMILAENEESKVVEDASHSLENKEVVTEAMAEVFEKQGMYEKAAGIYQKLSLQNPAKSAYFAARMEAFKH
ncbi:MAG: hypothetical protein NVSMB7_02130 [Chitinophagaceae bacterium]